MKRILGMLVFTVLLSEALGYRDLETGVFLTRDPIGYADGPNVYCYVHCNPITHFDAFGLSTYNPETKELDPDQHLNIYAEGEADAEDPTSGLILGYKEMEALLGTADEDGYVTLPGDRKLKESSLQKHVDGNKKITLEASAKGRSAQEALKKDGHMSTTEARQAEKEIRSMGDGGYGVMSWAEHWNARTALNDVGDLVDSPSEVKAWMTGRDFADKNSGISTIFGSKGGTFRGNWQLYPSKLSVYHGPNDGAGAYKWVNTDGREIVISAEGQFETRLEYAGTYNFGRSLLFNHNKLDIKPFKAYKGSAPYE